MLRLLERNIATIERRLVLLAPPDTNVPSAFQRHRLDPVRHRELVKEMQGLRGGIYVADGALRKDQLSPDGRHQTAEDLRSWHLLMLNRDHRVSSCVWYLEHHAPSSIQELRVRTCPLNGDHPLRARLRSAVHDELANAQKHGLRYAEVGGWAVSKHSRCSAEGLLLALGAYSLGRFFGGSLGLTTATVRHSSSTILRRLGGSHLEAGGVKVPPYFDEKYRCEMELLRFDSRRPNPKYADLIENLKGRLAQVMVISTQSANAGAAVGEPLFAA